VCLACFVPGAYAATMPAPDPPPLAVAPDPQPSKPVAVAPRRPRETPVVVRAPVVQSVAPAPVVTTAPAPVVERPLARKPVRRAAPKPAKKQRPAVQKSKPAPSPTAVVSTRPALREPWPPLPRITEPVPAAESLDRGRYALAGLALALVAVGGGVLVGVGGRTLKEATS
jgi:hypothetical protein